MSALVKKGFLVIVSLFMGLTLAASPAQAQLGVAAGYSLNIVNQPSFSSSLQNSFNSSGGVSAGLFYNFPLGDRISLRPGVFVQQSNFAWELDGINFSPIKSDIRMGELPVDVLYHFSMEQARPYIVAGPSFKFAHTNRPELRQVLDSPKGTTGFTAINLGAGIEIPFAGLGLKLLPELRYSHALSGFFKEDYTVRTVEYDTDGALSMSNLTFRLGISFLSIR